jgi:hypothetical protein
MEFSPFDIEEEDDEMPNIIQERFWSHIRASLYKKICKGKGGSNQWAYIMGKKRFDSKSNKIYLTEKNIKILQKTCDYLKSEEGMTDLLKVGITEAPEHHDDLISILANSKSKSETNKQEFKLFFKHKDDVIHYLKRFPVL